MKHVTACIVLLLVLSIGAPVKAAAPEKFEKECVKSLSKSERKRLHGEHEAYCRCVTEAGQRLGFTRKEFAIERERMSRDPRGCGERPHAPDQQPVSRRHEPDRARTLRILMRVDAP